MSMIRRRVAAIFLILSLSFPDSSYALRQTGLEESRPTRQQLIDSLTGGLEESAQEPDEDQLLAEVGKSWQYRIKDERGLHIDALEGALGGSKARTLLLHSAFKQFDGDIYRLPPGLFDLPVWQSPETGALYWGWDTLAQLSDGEIQDAFSNSDFESIAVVHPKEQPPPSPPKQEAVLPAVGPSFPQNSEPIPQSVLPVGQEPRQASPVDERPSEPGQIKVKAPSARVSYKPDDLEQLSFLELGEEILDSEKSRGRSAGRTGRLYKGYLQEFEGDEKRLPGAVENDEQKARRVALAALNEARRSRHLPSVTGKMLVENSRNPKVLRQFEFVFRQIVSSVSRVYEGLRFDREQGLPARPEPPEGSRSPQEYLQALRSWLLYEDWKESHLSAPTFGVGFVDFGADRTLGDPVPFGILSVLAVRQIGMEPSIRCFPELARGLVEKGVTKVEYLPPVPGNPPALRVQFKDPMRDRDTAMVLPALAMAVLKVPLPDLPSREGQREGVDLSDEELLEEADRSIRHELESVEWDEQELRSLVFTEDDPLDQRVARLEKLVRLALEGKLLPRSGYDLYSEEGSRRFARWLGRTSREQRVIQRDLKIKFQDAAERLGWRRPPATAQVQQELADRFDEWSQIQQALLQLGVPERTGDPQAERRVQRMVKRHLLDLATLGYLPLLRLLLVARSPEDSWLLSQGDERHLSNRLEKFRRTLQDAGSIVKELASSLTESDRAIFLAELNHAVLRALPAKPKEPFRQTTMDAVQGTLVRLNAQLLGADPERSPTALMLRRQERDALVEAVRSTQERIWELARSDISRPGTDEMERAVSELETAARELPALGLTLSLDPPPPVRLDSPPVFQQDLTQLRSWVVSSLQQAPETEPAADLAQAGLYRMLLELRMLEEMGDVQEAFQKSQEVLSRLGPAQGEKFLPIRNRAQAAKRRADQQAQEAALQRPSSLQERAAAILGSREYQTAIGNNRLLQEFLGAVAENRAGFFSPAKRKRLERFLRGKGARLAEPFQTVLDLLSGTEPRAGLEEQELKRFNADDPTGGAEQALALAQAGQPALLVTDQTDPSLIRDDRMLVMNLQIRNESPYGARRYVGRMKASRIGEGEWAYFKIDSTLKGPWVEAAKQLAEKLQPEILLVAPANVAQGRVTRQGVHGFLKEEGRQETFVPLHQTEYAGFLDGTLTEAGSDLTEYLTRHQIRPVVHLGFSVIERGVKDVGIFLQGIPSGAWVVADAVKPEHLAVLAQAVKETDRSFLCCGSAGLFVELVKPDSPVPLVSWVEQLQTARRGRGKILVLAGSRNSVSLDQVNQALRDFPDRGSRVLVETKPLFSRRKGSREGVIRKIQEEVRRGWRKGQGVILQLDNSIILRPGTPQQQALGELYRGLIGPQEGKNPLGLLVVFGGDTLDTVLRAFHAGYTARAEVTYRSGEPATNVSYGELLAPDRPPLPMVVKSEGFGRPELLSDLLIQTKVIATPRLAVTMGDPAGSGPELLWRALVEQPELLEESDLIVVGDSAVLKRAKEYWAIRSRPGKRLRIRPIQRIEEAEFGPGILNVLDLGNVDPILLERSFGPVGISDLDDETRRHFGRAALQYLDAAIELASAGNVDGIVTLPVTKEDIALVEPGFRGHTEYLGERLGTLNGSGEVTIALIHGPLRVLHVTTHKSLQEVVEQFQDPAITEQILERIRIAAQMGRRYFGLENPRIGVLGLNPHAGEGGLLGEEDQKRIQPAIDLALQEGLNVSPHPVPADTAFSPEMRGQWDFLIAMFHDQGHGPFKTVAGLKGVNFTGNLAVPRISPDFGTARREAWNRQRSRDLSPQGVGVAIRTLAQMIAAGRQVDRAGLEENPMDARVDRAWAWAAGGRRQLREAALEALRVVEYVALEGVPFTPRARARAWGILSQAHVLFGLSDASVFLPAVRVSWGLSLFGIRSRWLLSATLRMYHRKHNGMNPSRVLAQRWFSDPQAGLEEPMIPLPMGLRDLFEDYLQSQAGLEEAA